MIALPLLDDPITGVSNTPVIGLLDDPHRTHVFTRPLEVFGPSCR